MVDVLQAASSPERTWLEGQAYDMIRALALILSLLTGNAAAARAAAPISLHVDATILSDRSTTEDKAISVAASVINASDHDETVTIWTVFGWSWRTDNPCIAIDIPAAKNSFVMRTLKPNEGFQGVIDLRRVSCPREYAQVFWLGFVPDATVPVADNPDRYAGEPVFWSSRVVFPQ